MDNTEILTRKKGKCEDLPFYSPQVRAWGYNMGWVIPLGCYFHVQPLWRDYSRSQGHPHCGGSASPFHQPPTEWEVWRHWSSFPRALWCWIDMACSPWEGLRMGTDSRACAITQHSHGCREGKLPRDLKGDFHSWTGNGAEMLHKTLILLLKSSVIQDYKTFLKPSLIHQLNSLYSYFCIIKAE